MTAAGPVRVVAVIFDVGETLVDETRAWGAWADWLGVPRLTMFGVLGGVISRGEEHTRAAEILRPGLDLRAEAARLRSEIGAAWVEPGDLYPDALPALHRLAGIGYRLGVAGNQPLETEQVIRDLGVDLDLVASSSGLGVAKPDPKFFERIADALALPPAAIAYVGDRLDNDVRPAAAAGMRAIYIRRGPWAFIQELESGAPPEAAATINSLSELPEVLANLR